MLQSQLSPLPLLVLTPASVHSNRPLSIEIPTRPMYGWSKVKIEDLSKAKTVFIHKINIKCLAADINIIMVIII